MKAQAKVKTTDLLAEVQNRTDTHCEIKVTIPIEKVKAALDQAFQDVSKEANLKGFRKGKAPEQMIKQTYGKEIEGEALKNLLDDSFYEAMEQAGVKAVGYPQVTDLHFAPNEPFSYVAKVEIFPEIKIQKYKGLSLTLPDSQVTDDEIDKSLQSLREGHAELTPLPIARPLQKGDHAIIDYTGKVASQIILAGQNQATLPDLKGEGMTVEMGSENLIPGFEENLLGALPGEERSFEVKFPEHSAEELAQTPADHPARQLSGRDIQFKVKLHDIKTKVLPELNDDFARDLGKFSNLEDLRQQVKKDLEKINHDNWDRLRRREIIQALIDNNPLSIPSSLVDHEVQHFLEELHRRQHQHGPHTHTREEDEYFAKLGEEYRPQAEQRVKGALLLNAITEAEGISVDDQEVEQYLQKIAVEVEKPLEEIKRFYQTDERAESIKLKLREEKTLEFVTDHAKISKDIGKLGKKA